MPTSHDPDRNTEVVAATLSGDESLDLPEFDSPPLDPVELLASWVASAERTVREPLAATLATADRTGRPSQRVILVKEVAPDGLVFTSHHGSKKGRDLAENPKAALNLYWRETLQQVNIYGPVDRLSDEEADRLFAERPLAAQATTAVSRQSTSLDSEQDLHDRADALVQKGVAVPRPEGWGAYRLTPHQIEFWQGRSSRLHRRLRYDLTDDGWDSVRLQP